MKTKIKNSLVVALVAFLLAFVASVTFSAYSVRAEEDGEAPVVAENTVVMCDGASIRLTSPAGIKFTARIDDYVESADTVYGMLIMPYAYVERYISNGNYHAELAAKNVEVIDGQCSPYDYNDRKYISYSMTEVKYSNYNVEFCGIAYKKVGETYTYASITKEKNVRTLAQIASLMQSDVAYESLVDEQRAVIDSFVEYSAVVSETVINDDFSSGSTSAWDGYTQTADYYLAVDGKNGQNDITVDQSFSGITEISYDLRMHTSNCWTGLTYSGAYSALVLCRPTGLSGNAVSGLTSVSSVELLDKWITLKYEITSDTTGSFYYGIKGSDLTKVGDFSITTNNAWNLTSGTISFSTANADSVKFDIDNLTVKHSLGITTEDFNSAVLSDTVVKKSSANSVEFSTDDDIKPVNGELFVNTGKYFKMNGGSINQNSFIRTKGLYSNVKSYGFNLRFKGTGASWTAITTGANVYASPLWVYYNKITSYSSNTDNSTLYDVNGNQVNQISVDFTDWKTLRIVPVGVQSDGSEKADVYVGDVGGVLAKVGYFIVSSNKLSSVPVSTSIQVGYTSAGGLASSEIDVANFQLSYLDGEATKVVTDNSFDGEGALTIFAHQISETDSYAPVDFTTDDYCVTHNLIAKESISGGENMNDDSAIIYSSKVKYVYGEGKFDITFNYGGEGVYGERLSVENGKLVYYVGETLSKEILLSNVALGDEVVLEFRLYKSGAISLRVNGEENSDILRESGEFGTFAIFAIDGTNELTGVVATSYSIPSSESAE